MNRRRPSQQALQAECDKFNARCALGAPVTVKLDGGGTYETTTTSPAQVLGGHSAVIWLNGISGCYSLDQVTPAPAARCTATPIELHVPVERDGSGWWTNPAIPDFEEDHSAYHSWLDKQCIETTYDLLQDQEEDHPAYVEYYRNEGSDVSAWHCDPPKGEGWHTLSIHDSEDGPVWIWARRPVPLADVQPLVAGPQKGGA